MTEINKVREGEKDNYQTSQKALGDTVSLVEDIVNLHNLLNSLVLASRIPPKDEFVMGSLLMGSCRYHLVIACLAIERGHLTDSFFNTRTAIESCAFAYRIKKHPHLAEIWLDAANNEESYSKYRGKFSGKKLFPDPVTKSDFQDENLALRLLEEKIIKNDKEDPDYVYFDNVINEDQLKKRLEQIGVRKIKSILAIWRQSLLHKLGKRYDSCCKKIHSSIYSLAAKIRVENQENEFNIRHEYCELKENDHGEPVRSFIWTIDTHKYILDIFSVIFEEAVNHDRIKWDISYNGLLAKLETHKARWKNKIIRS